MMNFPSLYFWLLSKACSLERERGFRIQPVSVFNFFLHVAKEGQGHVSLTACMGRPGTEEGPLCRGSGTGGGSYGVSCGTEHGLSRAVQKGGRAGASFLGLGVTSGGKELGAGWGALGKGARLPGTSPAPRDGPRRVLGCGLSTPDESAVRVTAPSQ